MDWDGGKVNGKADWTVRRAGMHSKLIIKVEPVFPLAWLWHEMDYYEKQYRTSIRDAFAEGGQERMTLQQIALTTEKPPPLRCTLRAFLRKYPEQFHLEINQNSSVVTVSLNDERRRIACEV